MDTDTLMLHPDIWRKQEIREATTRILRVLQTIQDRETRRAILADVAAHQGFAIMRVP